MLAISGLDGTGSFFQLSYRKRFRRPFKFESSTFDRDKHFTAIEPLDQKVKRSLHQDCVVPVVEELLILARLPTKFPRCRRHHRRQSHR